MIHQSCPELNRITGSGSVDAVRSNSEYTASYSPPHKNHNFTAAAAADGDGDDDDMNKVCIAVNAKVMLICIVCLSECF